MARAEMKRGEGAQSLDGAAFRSDYMAYSFAIFGILEFLEFFWLTAGMQSGGWEKKGKREVDIRPLRRFPRCVVEVLCPDKGICLIEAMERL